MLVRRWAVEWDWMRRRHAVVMRRRARALKVARRYGLPVSHGYIRANLGQLLALADGRTDLEGYVVCEVRCW